MSAELYEVKDQEVKADEQIEQGFISRVIEYLPSAGQVTARDCVYAGDKYSKGSVIKMVDGNEYQCSGDKEGSWDKVKKK